MSRSRFCSLPTAAATAAWTLAISSTGWAQDPMAEPPPPETVSPAPEPLPPPIAVPLEAPPPLVSAPATEVAEEKPVTAEEEEKSWTDGFTVGAFVDAYAALRSDSNEERNPEDSTVANPAGYGHEAYVQGSGFGLAFAGADLAYAGEQFGATISLRFGPGVNRFYAADMGAFGIDNITQGFVTWKPGGGNLTLDLGQFYTIYGAEVAESWRNVNYSRGALYYAMQPFWHTGLRANYKFGDAFAINALVVNGVNTAFEGNKSPSLGLQLLLTPTDMLAIAVGYLGGLNPRDGDDETAITGNFQDFFDVVATVTGGNFKLVLNADYNRYRIKGQSDSESWWGISAAPAIAATKWFTIGARVEYLEDTNNSQLLQSTMGKAKLTTLTGTLDFKPVPDSGVLVLRPELRYEIAGSDVFHDGDVGNEDLTDKFWSLHIGAVVTSMP